ncbi:TetR/AcrR family transcriptional regulator [Gordonia sp. ABSL1-1]|uniref:TetR/AcrR family transcriptional regulator n=1 Tax=Gordonia sp. ABSL1-1 TaxID=3053923 RepID=UPI0025724834|nr:TetR/AcrR family transcriptional regulator [Gordonia sp. ABSL1-1]MDL9938237.1 TetR/AcrR family transcriptional regulator [Gordonia sp. ABSL1-1]
MAPVNPKAPTGQVASSPAGNARRRSPTRRKSDTRARLLDAAFAVFVAKGFGRTRIDDICQTAGYTKGAFYSNFDSLEQLFFALYDRESAYGADFTGAVAAEADPNADARDLVAAWAANVLIDRDWLLINTDFVSFAARYPDIAADLTTHRRALREQATARLAEAIVALAVPLPESLPTPEAFARSIVTIYDGVIYQLLLDMDEATVRDHFVAIISALLPPR